MKKFFLILAIWLSTFYFLLSTVSAYSPTSWDIQQINTLKVQLNNITKDNNQDLLDFYYQIKSLQKKLNNQERLDYILNELANYLYWNFLTKKNQAKQWAKLNKQNFVNTYISWISLNWPILNWCTWRYNTLDDMSFAYNIPTALTIASRYRETNCGYYLPKNWDWPFQILSKDYGTGEITDDIFVQSAQDYLEFANRKHSRYNDRNAKSWLRVNISYTNFDFTGIVRHWALYNGLSWSTVYWDIKPMKPWYVFDGYGQEFSWAKRYGILPQFIKILDRELKNKY